LYDRDKNKKIKILLEQKASCSFQSTTACGQGGRAARGARAAGSKGRGAAPLSHLQQLADQRRAQLRQRFADLAACCTPGTAPAQELALRSASAANTKARRMKLHDNVRAVIVKEVQLRDLVLTGALHCCSRASPSTSSPTFNCPLPRLRRPPADPNAATTDKDCDPSGSRSSANGLWGQAGPPTSTRPPPTQGLRSERRAARRPTDYGARARAGGTCRVAVLHAASVIACWGCATGAASLRTAPASRTSTKHRHSYQHTITIAASAAHPQHPMTLAACNTATRHVQPALALAP